MPFLRPTPSLLRGTRIASLTFNQPFRRTFNSRKTAALNSPVNRLRNGLIGSAIIGSMWFLYYSLTDTRTESHQYEVIPVMKWIFKGDDVPREEGGKGVGPEKAHEIGLKSLIMLYDVGLGLRERGEAKYLEQEGMGIELFGHHLKSPLAISAGFDKHAQCIDPIFNLSPSISLLEVGCITPLPQSGNPKPRLFRLPTSTSLINRYGFNSTGADSVANRLRTRVRRYAKLHNKTEQEILDSTSLPASLWPNRLLAIQIGKNKSTPETDLDAVKKDYITCVEKLGKYADIIVVNVSSPNTPGLRSLQRKEPLTELLTAVVEATKNVPRRVKPKVVVKVSPDSDSEADVKAVSAAVKASKVDGVIVANTTVKRPPYLTSSPQTTEEEKRIVAKESGGLSGPALLPKTLELVEMFSKELKDDGIVVFASGGITNGKDAVEARKRGAKVVMGYTGMVFEGVGFWGKVGREMSEILKKEGLS